MRKMTQNLIPQNTLSPKIMKSLPRNLIYHQIKRFSTIPIAFALISLKHSIVILLNLLDKIIQYSITLALQVYKHYQSTLVHHYSWSSFQLYQKHRKAHHGLGYLSLEQNKQTTLFFWILVLSLCSFLSLLVWCFLINFMRI